MNHERRQLLQLAMLAGGLGARTSVRADEAYPSKPVTLIVPYPAGGVVDIIGRLVSDRMAASMKTSFVVENRAGAGGTIGAASVARARPDGYTLLLGGSATHVFAPSLYRNLAYDPVADFAPIGRVSSAPLVLVVNAASGVRTLPELVAFLKQRGDKANYASNGNGTFPHLAGELFKQAEGVATTHVPYSGGPGALTALISGDVTLSINHIPVVQAMIKSGQLRAIATTGAKRSRAYPNVPTLEELGLKGFEANAWFGLFAPARTPAPVVARLSVALADALKDETVVQRLLAQGDEPSFDDPQAFAAFVAAETARWSKVIKTASITIN